MPRQTALSSPFTPLFELFGSLVAVQVGAMCSTFETLKCRSPFSSPTFSRSPTAAPLYATYGGARLKRDESGMWHGTIQSVDLRVEGACVPSTETLQKEGSGSQTFYAPRGEGDHFLVIAWSGHEDHECNGRWTISGSHPLAKAVTIGSSIYGCCFPLQGGGYRMDAAK